MERVVPEPPVEDPKDLRSKLDKANRDLAAANAKNLALTSTNLMHQANLGHLNEHQQKALMGQLDTDAELDVKAIAAAAKNLGFNPVQPQPQIQPPQVPGQFQPMQPGQVPGQVPGQPFDPNNPSQFDPNQQFEPRLRSKQQPDGTITPLITQGGLHAGSSYLWPAGNGNAVVVTDNVLPKDVFKTEKGDRRRKEDGA